VSKSIVKLGIILNIQQQFDPNCKKHQFDSFLNCWNLNDKDELKKLIGKFVL
jgi:hypothetical protein